MQTNNSFKMVLNDTELALLRQQLSNRFHILNLTRESGGLWPSLAISGAATNDGVLLCGMTPEQYMFNYNNPEA